MKKIVITIGRELGSGGRTIGKIVAQKLGIDYYDYEIIDETAKESGFSTDFVQQTEQRVTSSLLYNLALGSTYGISPYGRIGAVNLETQIFLTQQKVIREMAEKGSCVIVGRCADYILKEYDNVFKVFVYADMEHRRNHLIENYGYKPELTLKEIKKADKRRSGHYLAFTEQRWGSRENYDLMINSGILGAEKSAELIIDAVKKISE